MSGAGVNASTGNLRQFSSHTKLDPSALADLLRGPNGPAARQLMIVGERVKERAQQLVGVSKPDPIPRRKPRVPGTLKNSIVKRLELEGDKLKVRVGSPLPEAWYHHQGTPGGQVIEVKAPKVLCFFANGEVVFTRRVKRGATPANPFLKRALDEA